MDENGRVKEGYEGRVEFILNELNSACGTEYQLIDGTIDKYGELKKSINEIIKTKKAEIILDANKKAYTQALEEQLQLYQNKELALKDLKTAEEELAKAEKEWLENRDSNIRPKELDDLKDKVDTLRNTYDRTCKKWKENSETIVKYQNLQVSVIEGDNKKIEQAISELSNTYELEGERVNATLEEQIKMQQEFANDAKEIYKQAGKEINKEEEARLNSGIETLAKKLVEQTNTVETLTDDQINAWKALAEGSEQIYNEKISNVNEDTRLALEAILGKVDTNSPKYIQKWVTMASESSNRYNNILSKMPENTRQEIQKAVDAVNGKKTEMASAGSSLAGEAIKGANQKVNDKKSGISVIGQWFVSGFLGSLQSKGALDGAFGAGWNLIKSAITGGKEAQNSHSPSKETLKLGNYFTEGYILGLKEKQAELRKTAGNLVGTALNEMKQLNTDGITINPNDFKIDTNQFIDYGQISGAIAMQSNVNVSSDIEGRIENAIYRGLSNATIPVEIEATTDEGVIFKKVQTKAREFSMQTGEPAFDF